MFVVIFLEQVGITDLEGIVGEHNHEGGNYFIKQIVMVGSCYRTDLSVGVCHIQRSHKVLMATFSSVSRALMLVLQL